MKQILSILTLSAIMMTNTAQAVDAVIKDNSGNTTGYIKTDGKKAYLYDKQGYRQGVIEDDGTIKDKRGYRKGRVERTDKK
ncbi:MAG: hypothetical protein KZQ58_00940 [gamma proteobacterium symbiont of Bathyaustriella thionipta]|nr:hypothetical protein [gamma proteobacterium symbiont of Bathyaustriella thionipta]